MVDVVLVLVERRPDLRGVTIRAVNTVVPVAEVTGRGVQPRGLHVGVLGHFGQLVAVVNELVVVRRLTVGAVTPRIEDQFREGVVGQGGSEFTGAVTGVVVHLGQVLNEFGLRLGVAAPPVFIGHAVGVVVLAVDVVFVDLTVTVVVTVVHRPVVHVVVGDASPLVFSGCARSGHEGAGSAQRGAPLELVVTVEVHTVAVLVHVLVQVGQRRDPGERVVTQVLSPSAGGARLPCRSGTEDFAVVDVAVGVQHGDDVELTAVDQVGDPLLAVILVDTQVAGSASGPVAVGILERGVEGQAIAVVVEDAVAVVVAPAVFVHAAVAVVVVTDVVVRERDHFDLHHGHLVRHPLASVVVADDEHVVAVGVVAVVAYEFVVFAPFHVPGDLQPRRGVAVVPAFVGVGCRGLATCVDPTVQALVELKNVRIFLGQTLHAQLHGLVGVVFFELKDALTLRSPRENHVDVIVRPNILGSVTGSGFLNIDTAGNRAGQRQQEREGDEEAQRRARGTMAWCNGCG